ncbi:MAG: L-lysine 6-transaminase [Candidatus Heimdallarchaeaceae archaeon]
MDALEKLSKHMLVDGFPMILDLTKSKGSRLFDKKSGKMFLDLFSFFASAPIGMNHPDMLDKEFLKVLTSAAIMKPSCSDFYTDEMANFVETFDRVGIPDFLPNLFLISGGALAVENALKAAFDWKIRKNFEKSATEEKGSKVIHFREAFHGRTGYTLSLTNTFDPRKIMYYPKFPNWPRVLNPKIIFPLEQNLERVKAAEEQSISQIQEAIDKYGDDIAALIIEPIQGEGGDNHFRKEFFEKLRAITEDNEIIFVLDEVQTGVGITGKFWAFEHFGENAKPDIIAFGKKTQVCGILASNKIKEVKNNVFEESSRINSTWGGNLTDMVRVTRYLEIIEKHDLVANARNNGEYMLKQLHELQEEFSELISNSRGRGFMVSFDLPSTEIRDKIKKDAFDKYLLLLGCGEKTIRFRPYLDTTKDIIDEAMSILHEVLKNL